MANYWFNFIRKIVCLFIFGVSMMNVTLGQTKSLMNQSELYHLVKQPQLKSAHPPVIFLLHGVGSNEKDLFSFASQLPEKYLVISLRAPYMLGPDSYGWYEVDFSSGKPIGNIEQAEKSKALILKNMDELAKKYSYDLEQVYLCGFSQGAIMSYSVGLTYPDKIKGMAIMSGRLLEEVKPQVKTSHLLKGLEIFISHGTLDNVLQVGYARDAKTFLNQLGIVPLYKEYPVSHTISAEMLGDLINWLKK